MVTYKTIVVPTDGSENAKRALEHALAVAPGPALLAVAKKYNADLIVMGSRGLGPLKGLFMGSVSSYVTSHSTCPVLIIK